MSTNHYKGRLETSKIVEIILGQTSKIDLGKIDKYQNKILNLNCTDLRARA